MGSGAGKMDDVQDSLQAEAVSGVQAMNQAIQWGMTNVMVETDAKLLVQSRQQFKEFRSCAQRCPV